MCSSIRWQTEIARPSTCVYPASNSRWLRGELRGKGGCGARRVHRSKRAGRRAALRASVLASTRSRTIPA
eukprot:2183441-Pleurochrysis_carterae.AAC.2